MNIYMTQPVRKKHGISWEEEYILGLIDHAEEVRVTAVLGIANEVMTQATAHKYLTQLIDKKYVKHVVGKDKRIKVVELTRAGIRYLDELSNDSVSVS
jgi:DNA-binding MarR family transcriptional regulator